MNKSQQKPDLQLDELLCDINKRAILGRIVTKIHVIEFQKRGLPHAHSLIWLCSVDKLRTADDVDRLICAEIPDPVTQPQLYKVVKSTRVHGRQCSWS